MPTNFVPKAVVLAKGSEAQLEVKRVTGGGVFGNEDLTLDVHSVTAGGASYILHTSMARLGKHRRATELAGGGATLEPVVAVSGGGGKVAQDLVDANAGAERGGLIACVGEHLCQEGKERGVVIEDSDTRR